jgi:hypothetical protein
MKIIITEEQLNKLKYYREYVVKHFIDHYVDFKLVDGSLLTATIKFSPRTVLHDRVLNFFKIHNNFVQWDEGMYGKEFTRIMDEQYGIDNFLEVAHMWGLMCDGIFKKMMEIESERRN